MVDTHRLLLEVGSEREDPDLGIVHHEILRLDLSATSLDGLAAVLRSAAEQVTEYAQRQHPSMTTGSKIEREVGS